jgi:hypothetical protein
MRLLITLMRLSTVYIIDRPYALDGVVALHNGVLLPTTFTIQSATKC